ncbi:hypothetical protein O181_046607 [Austropuccinia psidii MF-1]|uniref:Uncharacterized protein n=1 Tax=Austropuccinia psidii MF-1 TaxID=1389203 RepID=A0A9Q3HJU7_9BASI|nr:hypothetical protein [Austropuccinia psidii MF-1]
MTSAVATQRSPSLLAAEKFLTNPLKMIFVKTSPLKISPFIIALCFKVFCYSRGNFICDSAYSIPTPGGMSSVYCETYDSANSRIGHDCKPSSCHPPQFKACYKPQKSGKFYVRNYQKPLHVETMHSFQVRSVQNVAFAYAGSFPEYVSPSSAPDAICELGAKLAFCDSARSIWALIIAYLIVYNKLLQVIVRSEIFSSLASSLSFIYNFVLYICCSPSVFHILFRFTVSKL